MNALLLHGTTFQHLTKTHDAQLLHHLASVYSHLKNHESKKARTVSAATRVVGLIVGGDHELSLDSSNMYCLYGMNQWHNISDSPAQGYRMCSAGCSHYLTVTYCELDCMEALRRIK